MPQFLLELFSEEIPARMQDGAARDLDRLAREGLARADLAFETLKTFAGSRRLTLVVDGLATVQADRVDERKGPRIGAPEPALAGFLRSAGVAREALTQRDGVYWAVTQRAGRPVAEILEALTGSIVARFPWPKSMTWGSGSLRWVRPLQRILCVFDRRIIPAAVAGVPVGDLSEGHRFMGSRRSFKARDFDEYNEALAANFVILDVAERKRLILDGSHALCAGRGLELVEDAGLLDEVAGMVEWPTPILGDMNPRFLELPPEVIRTSMRTHQRYFAVRGAGGGLAPYFLCVANIQTADGGALIAAGNARVLSARLDDARFFWEEDGKLPLETRLEKLKGVTFHAQLGSMYQRVERIEALARAIAPRVGADPDLAARAARLAKADLGTGMVGEFPELQGVMGGYYAAAQAEPAAVSEAVRDHYKPQGPGDLVPVAPVSIALALADKFDSLAGFFSIGQAPTGSGDPFALRRAALGVIRIIMENDLRLSINDLIGQTAFASASGAMTELSAFFVNRLKVLLRDWGKRHDLVDAVLVLGDDDLVRVVARIEALAAFLATEDGANLLAGYKRASNILAAEAKKGALPVGEPLRTAAPPEESALFDALAAARPSIDGALAAENFADAMTALADLRATVDAFFEKVLVNADDPEVRANRLRLLVWVRSEMGKVADFTLVSG